CKSRKVRRLHTKLYRGAWTCLKLALRSGAEADELIDQLDDIRSPQISWDQGQQIHSIPDAIAEAMKRHQKGGRSDQQTTYEHSTDRGHNLTANNRRRHT
ncbi:MAG: hypothetical protein J07AB43_11350, partial [Candidatus Nanosalina sp. J07AB43]